MRLIDADALYESFGASGNCNNCPLDAYKCQYYNEHTLMEFCERIDDAPTVDVESLIAKHEDIGYEKGFRDGYAEALTDNVPDKNVGEWIPCSERLPDKEGYYLCTVDAEYHNVREMIYDPDEFISEEYRSIWKSIDGYHAFNWFVIAWMPIPKPHKMDEVEDGKI